MLNRYWNSPPLALTPRPSGFRRRLGLGLVVALGLSIFVVYDQSYPLLALVMLPASLVTLWLMRDEPGVGVTFGWRGGQWFVFREGELERVILCRGWVCLDWLICLELAGADGCHHSFYLFMDSADRGALRRLRRRLALER